MTTSLLKKLKNKYTHAFETINSFIFQEYMKTKLEAMKSLAIILLMLISMTSISQTQVITGKIIDQRTNETLPFANITLSSNHSGTISNREGNFTLGIADLQKTDSIVFSYLGYKNYILKPDQIKSEMVIPMIPLSIELDEISISSRSLVVNEILDSVKSNFMKNMQYGDSQKEVFVRRYHTQTMNKPFLFVKDIDFEGIDKETIEELLMQVPEENVSYQDALVKMYTLNNETKLLPIEAISLEEKTEMNEMLKEKLDTFLIDIKESYKDTTIYYKIKSGILKSTLNMSEEQVEFSIGLRKKKKKKEIQEEPEIPCESDSIYFASSTKNFKNSLLYSLGYHAHIANNPVFSSSKDYEFTLDDVSFFNNEPVYLISFEPKRKGLYEGSMRISTSNYALLQIDYQLKKGKHGKKFNVLGIGYHEKYKKYKLIYAAEEGKYHIKYFYQEEEKDVSIERNIKLSKMQKRTIGGKTLDEIKVKTNLFTNATDIQEILVINRQTIDSIQYDHIIEPPCVQYKKLYGYTPEMWQDNSIMEPVQKFKNYKRKIR